VSEPVLRTLLDALAGATGAGVAWIADTSQEPWTVAHATGAGAPAVGAAWPGGGVVAFVVESDQPAALVPRAGVDLTADVEAVLGRRPTAVLVVPCADDSGPVGALGLADKGGGGPFSFDDIELAALLGPVAAAALADGRTVETPPPAALGAALAELAAANPVRYRRVAAAVVALLAADG
jgi:sigma-B regulation protein RsbU (phosphoserine phosphatase)